MVMTVNLDICDSDGTEYAPSVISVRKLFYNSCSVHIG
jgi:hypothetical protein